MYMVLGCEKEEVKCIAVFDNDDTLIDFYLPEHLVEEVAENDVDVFNLNDLELTKLTHDDPTKAREFLDGLIEQGFVAIDTSEVETFNFSGLNE